MFVSPPPATSSIHLLPRRSSRSAAENVAGRNTQSPLSGRGLGDILEEYPNDGASSIFSGSNRSARSSVSGRQAPGSMRSRDASQAFVTAPPEYTDKARDEIRRRLLPAKSRQSSMHSRSERASLDSRSLYSDNASSYQSSIFSAPVTLESQDSSLNIVVPKCVTEITLEDALPHTFYDMYVPEMYINEPTMILPNGRPEFTKRELLDWEINDIRSLLIVERLRPEWGGKLPNIINGLSIQSAYRTNGTMPQFRLQYLPLCAQDEQIIQTLVESDLFLEADLDYKFKVTSARYTVAAARRRHEQLVGISEPVMHLTKPEWRNIIENYLLNIAVEAQCRFDFKQKCLEFKKWKASNLVASNNMKRPNMPPPKMVPGGQDDSLRTPSKNLLKRTLIKNLQHKYLSHGNGKDSLDTQSISETNLADNTKIGLTKSEKAQLWSMCQAQVYQRLGLDWKPDNLDQPLT